jgi:hypothetical protein
MFRKECLLFWFDAPSCQQYLPNGTDYTITEYKEVQLYMLILCAVVAL